VITVEQPFLMAGLPYCERARLKPLLQLRQTLFQHPLSDLLHLSNAIEDRRRQSATVCPFAFAVVPDGAGGGVTAFSGGSDHTAKEPG